jgi:hypothetical protein
VPWPRFVGRRAWLQVRVHAEFGQTHPVSTGPPYPSPASSARARRQGLPSDGGPRLRIPSGRRPAGDRWFADSSLEGWREADLNHRSREGGHRRLGRLICCSRESPRCRLFRLSGAEVLRRTQVV